MSKTDELSTKLHILLDAERKQIDRRLTWLGTFEGFLFAALGFVWDKSKPIVLLLTLLGLLIALLVLIGLFTATIAMEKIRRYWQEHKPVKYDGPDIFGFYPYKVPLLVYTSPENVIPVLFMIAWIFVLFIRLGS